MTLFQSFQPMAAIATTPTAMRALTPLWQSGVLSLWVPANLQIEDAGKPIQRYQGSLKEVLPTLWHSHRSLVFGLALGATVRLIAPLLQDKATDPAVVLVDATGQWVVSLCGGHQGGADRLTWAIAQALNATPIVTGGSHALDLLGVDVLGVPFGWQRGSGDWAGVSAAVARGEPVQVIQEAGCDLWQQTLPADHPFTFGFPDFPQSPPSPPAQARIWISPVQRRFAATTDCPKAQWHPRVLWVGVGCERGTPRRVIEAAVQQVFRANHLAESAIAQVCTIDLKGDEPGLLEFCRDRTLPLQCFSAVDLRSVTVPNPSAIVEAEVGTPSVAEAAAILGASRQSGADAQVTLRVAKQIFRQAGQPGAVTIAVAQGEREWTGRTGQLWLVGTGPGQLDQMTPAAQTAIAQADVVIGYSLYVDLVRSLLRPGQLVEALPITQERQRATRAIELAQWGMTVAVISSGDCGIYGMAGLVLEELRSQGWDGKTPSVQVFPGISALQSAASRVGAPLMHDFCAISLSDLLTPWEVIEKRLTAAAQADFVIALYNPKSKHRTEQIAIAQHILLQHRAPHTPVALVRSAYRPDEQIILATLATLLDHPIDMLTTVLIGNQSTRFHAGWMVTPRGYLGFEG